MENTAEAEEIAAAIHALTLDLLRRHIRRRAHDSIDGSDLRTVERRQGQTEVSDLHPLDAVFQHDIARLDVAVDDSLTMGRRQAVGDLGADP